LDPLTAARLLPLEERRQDAGDAVHAGPGIADLGARDEGRTILEAGRARGTAHALRDVLIGFAIGVGAGAEAFDRGVDHPGIELVDDLPAEALAGERAGREVLDQNIAGLDQPLEDLLALLGLGIDGDAALVA